MNASRCSGIRPAVVAVRLEPIREVRIHAEGFAAKRRSMMRIMAMRTKAAAMRQWRSKSRARRRLQRKRQPIPALS
jgi:hypothetical protein